MLTRLRVRELEKVNNSIGEQNKELKKKLETVEMEKQQFKKAEENLSNNHTCSQFVNTFTKDLQELKLLRKGNCSVCSQNLKSFQSQLKELKDQLEYVQSEKAILMHQNFELPKRLQPLVNQIGGFRPRHMNTQTREVATPQVQDNSRETATWPPQPWGTAAERREELLTPFPPSYLLFSVSRNKLE